MLPLSWRLTRFERRQRSSRWLIDDAVSLGAEDPACTWIRPPRPARCRWRVAELVGVHAPSQPDAFAHFSGLERCGSIWACPVCSAVIRARRALEISLALERAHTQGLGVVFTTLTLRHREDDSLAVTLDLLLEAWRRVQSWRAWRSLAATLGLVGIIRAVEVTYGAHGWHPHAHLAVIVDHPLTPKELESLRSELSTLWQRAVVKLGGRVPSLVHGVDVRSADSPSGIADYVAKSQEHIGRERRSVAVELARGDLKQGRGGSLMPFELLDDRSGASVVRSLWCEFVAATKGRRAFAWSRGLRSRLIGDVEDLEDDQVLDRCESGRLVALIPAATWDSDYRDRPSAMHDVLCDVEEAHARGRP